MSSDMDLYSPTTMHLPESPSIAKCLIHHHDFVHIFTSDKSAHFIAKEVQQWAHALGNDESYHISHHPVRPGPSKLTEDLIMAVVRQIHEKMCFCLTGCSLCFKSVWAAASPMATGPSRSPETEVEAAPLSFLYLITSSQEYCFLSQQLYDLLAWRS